MTSTNAPWEKIKDKPYCDPGRRMDFALLFDVRDGNPNGDPDAGNLPRMDPTDRHGIVTDVCIKRKVRDYLADVLGQPIHIQSTDTLNTLYFRAARGIAAYDPGGDGDASDDEKKRRSADREAVASMLLELDESDEGFHKLVAVSEKTKEAKTDEEGREPRGFREWLKEAAGEIDGLDFDDESGSLRYLGEAKSATQFRELLSLEGLPPDEGADGIKQLAGLLSRAKPKKSTNSPNPNSPYTTDGTPARLMMAIRMARVQALSVAYSAR